MRRQRQCSNGICFEASSEKDRCRELHTFAKSQDCPATVLGSRSNTWEARRVHVTVVLRTMPFLFFSCPKISCAPFFSVFVDVRVVRNSFSCLSDPKLLILHFCGSRILSVACWNGGGVQSRWSFVRNRFVVLIACVSLLGRCAWFSPGWRSQMHFIILRRMSEGTESKEDSWIKRIDGESSLNKGRLIVLSIGTTS